MSKIKSILFVCTGNSCRSAMAEGLMKERLKELGKTEIKVSSAGIGTIGGFPATPEAVSVLKAEGIDISAHKSRRIDEDMVKKADLILVMEDIHREFIDSHYPEGSYRTYLLKEYGRDKELSEFELGGIPDPIGRPIEFYKLSMAVIDDQVSRIAKLL